MRKTLSVAILCCIIACSAPYKVSITNVNDLASYSNNNYLYSLPMTRIVIEITALRHLTIPGPYNAFTEKYLGFDGVPSISKTDWEVLDIHISTIEEPDPEYCYMLETEQPANVLKQLEELSASGLIVPPYKYFSFSGFYPDFNDKPEPVHFTDITIKGNIEKDNSKSKERKDNADGGESYTGRHKDDLKTLEQKAEDAADFIIKLRKRRFKLLAGMDAVVVGQSSIETSVRELHALEAEYLSLFTGKTYCDTLRKTFVYNPLAEQEFERNIFCRFSDETGYQDPMGTSGMPMVLELKNQQLTNALDDPQMPSAGPVFSGMLLYRIPDKATVRIFYGSTTVLEGEVTIYQYGPLVPAMLDLE